MPSPTTNLTIVAVMAGVAALGTVGYFAYQQWGGSKRGRRGGGDNASRANTLYATLGDQGAASMYRMGLELADAGQPTPDNLQPMLTKAFPPATLAKLAAQNLTFAQTGTKLLGAPAVASLNAAKIAVRSMKAPIAPAQAPDASVTAIIGPDIYAQAKKSLQFVQST